MIRYKSLAIAFFHDMLMIPLAWVLAYWLRYSLDGLNLAVNFSVLEVLFVIIGMQVIFYWYFGVQRSIWRFTSLSDLVSIVKSVIASSLASVAMLFWLDALQDIPRSIFPIYAVLLIALLSGSRLFCRYLKERYRSNLQCKRVLIIGAGNAGEILVRDLLRSKNHSYRPVAFVDDSRSKQGKEIHGLRVLGKIDDIPKIVMLKKIDCIVIAIPSAKAAEMRRIVELCRITKIPFQTLPSLREIAAGEVTMNALREVSVEDLLGRDEVRINWQELKAGIQDEIVLVSGGGGSIGSEICRQVAKLHPKALVVIENCEFNLYKLQQEIYSDFPNLSCALYLGSIADEALVRSILRENKPNIIFHAAAYKHVPLLESQPYSAYINNVLGTKVFASEAVAAEVDKFVLISTDKAVRPANIMGATKRIAEMICQRLNGKGITKFITVRFGNVLGSSGSVIGLFKEQLAHGGPLTVTHPDMTRFFMTIPEAVLLILQACFLGKGGESFVLDMGEPIKISYLAEQMIRLSGKEVGTDVDIVYSGLRPGEKLYEELFYKHENIAPTLHEKILQATESLEERLENLEEKIEKLGETIYSDCKEEFHQALHVLVPELCCDAKSEL
ncbi:MAG: nucleoside-diphosphate sugar epimerase/dehydratase [Gammaproteobacteria bacterium]